MYDKVGNRTSLSIEAVDATTEISVDRTYEYNTLNQLKKRYDGASWSGADGDARWSYEYDANGNLTQAMKEEKASGTWDEKLRWEYEWNPRDQMELAVKWVDGSIYHSGRVEYRYCLSCDGALSERIEREPGSGSATPIESWQRYEYHGLDLVRVDERYDSNSSGTLTSADAWRTLEVSSHRPGAIGSLLAKRVYTHTNNDATPDQTDDFYYTYDPVGNVVSVVDDSGNEAYHFTQEAFGNELPVNVLGGSDWDDAANERIVEHQTGKWKDEFTGLYYFHARWYEPEVGRFVSTDKVRVCRFYSHPYAFVRNSPTGFLDPDGNFEWDNNVPDESKCSFFQKWKMKRQINQACDKLQTTLVMEGRDEPLVAQEVKECILDRCQNGKMQCRCGCPEGHYGKTGLGATWENNPGELQEVRFVYTCVGKTASGSSLHEWGHECGCLHPEGNSAGGDYVDSGACGFLAAANKRRGWD